MKFHHSSSSPFLLLILLPAVLFPLWASAGAVTESPDSAAIRSFRLLQQKADNGDNAARYRLARTLETGYEGVVERDSSLAVSLYRIAAENGYAPAQNYMGFLCFYNDRPDSALYWMKKAAHNGDVTAYTNLGWMLLNGSGAHRDFKKAHYWLQQGAKAGSAPAETMLGDMYRRGDGCPADTATAIMHYNRAVDLYATGRYHDREALTDIAQALASLYPAPQQIHTDSLLSLGKQYLSTLPTLGVSFFSQAAQRENPHAQAVLAKAYAFGYGVPYSHAASLEWYLRAALNGNPSAQFVIGELLQLLPDALADIPTDIANTLSEPQRSASYWIEQAAKAGINDARQADDALGYPKFP